METLRPGSTVSHYRVLGELGSGGMGAVYLAEDTRLNRKAAIKVMLPEVAADPERLRRFEQEAQAASALNHPNIITVYEFAEEDGAHCLITEFVDGRTLREVIRSGELSTAAALGIAEQVAFALSAAHAAGIVHRDLKPENILIRRDGIVKVVDFGLAKLLEAPKVQSDGEAETRALVKTDPGSVMGTAAYMSPEQARGKEADARSDIWSLGVLIYEMISGRMAFEGENANEVIASILKSEPEPISQFVPDIPRELEKLIGKCLRKDREERFQNTKDLWLDLKDLRQELEYNAKLEHSTAPDRARTSGVAAGAATASGMVAATDPSAVPVSSATHQASSAEYVVSEIRQHKRGFFAVAGVLVLALAGLGWWFLRSTPASTEAGKITSLAVLPFENGSGSAEMDYLSDELPANLIDKLSQLPQLEKVIARTSSFKYRGPNVDVQDIAKKLGVQAIITGKVAKFGDQLSVRVELVDVSDNKQIWGEQYNRKATDALAVQQEIAKAIAEKLKLRLSGDQRQQLANTGTSDPRAYDLFLRGKVFDERGGKENRKKANQFFEQAIAVDPGYALAYAELSGSYSVMAGSSSVDPKDYIPKAEATARKALELDQNLPEGHRALATVYLHQWKWDDQRRELERAIELDPNSGGGHRAYAFYLTVMGRHDEAVAAAKRGLDLDPVAPNALARLGLCLHYARRNDEALEMAKKVVELDPDFAFGYTLLAYVYAAAGRHREAIDVYDNMRRKGFEMASSDNIYLGAEYAALGERAKALEILNQLKRGKEYVSPGDLPVLLVALGDHAAAIASFEKAFQEHDLQLLYLRIDPAFDPIRNDPRFVDLVRRVFPE
jgi:serine/threonine-protein kinase